jgi:hypothetical protein
MAGVITVKHILSVLLGVPRPMSPSRDLTLTYPITGIAGCRARAASDNALAAPTSVMKSSRLIASPKDQDYADNGCNGDDCSRDLRVAKWG